MYTETYVVTQANIAVSGNTVIQTSTDGRVKNGVIPLGNCAETITVQVSPVTAAIDALVMDGRVTTSDTFKTIRSSGWDTVDAGLTFTSGDAAATAAGGYNIFCHDVRGLEAIRFQASANTSVVTLLTLRIVVRYTTT